MLQQYKALKAEYPDAILLFRMGDFYSAWADDAKQVSGLLGLTLCSMGGVPTVTMPYHHLQIYVAKLVVERKRVVVIEKADDVTVHGGTVETIPVDNAWIRVKSADVGMRDAVVQSLDGEYLSAADIEPCDIEFVRRDAVPVYMPSDPPVIIAGWTHNGDGLRSVLDSNGLRDYRRCDIHLHAHAFGLPRCNTFDLCVFYHPDLIFNIEPPDIQIADEMPTVFDAMWELRERPVERYNEQYSRDYHFDSVLPTQLDCKPWIPYLATGWTLREVIEYADTSPELAELVPPQGIVHHIKRLTWCVGCEQVSSNSSFWVHPWHHRRITLGELAALAGYYGPIDNALGDIGMALWNITQCLPTPVAEWLLRQCKLCLDGGWGAEDYQSTYRHNGVKLDSEGQWIGGDTTGEPEKRFMLYDWRAMGYDYDRFPVEARNQMHRFQVAK